MAANIESKFCPPSSPGKHKQPQAHQGEEMLARSRNRENRFLNGAFHAISAGRPGVRGLSKGTAALLLASLLVATPVTATAKDSGFDDDSPSVALDWQRIALRTMFTDSQPPTPVPASPLYLGFTSLAVDDAVGTAIGKSASASAAAAVAAHDVLVTYFRASTANLDADLAKSLSAVPNGRAERDGIEIGKAAAAAMVASREDDGRNTEHLYKKAHKAGIWQPPATGMAVPWLGFVKPLVLRNTVSVDGPDPIDSAAYATDFNEVKRVGSATSSERTANQTETAKFFGVNPVVQLRLALLDHLVSHPLSLARTTQLFAAVDAATADAAWKPFIETLPSGTTPPYPDYVSGHACVVGAFTAAVRPVLGDVSLSIPSLVTNRPERTYPNLSAIEDDAFMARIWLGIHFRDAMEDGYRIGHETGKQVSSQLT